MSDPTETDVVRRKLDTSREAPATGVAETVAELEDEDYTELSPLYDCIDHVLDDLFSTPPAPEAQVEISFDYAGYRITVEQTGDVTLVDTE